MKRGAFLIGAAIAAISARAVLAQCQSGSVTVVLDYPERGTCSIGASVGPHGLVYDIKLSKNATVAGDIIFMILVDATIPTRIGAVSVETNPAGTSKVFIGSQPVPVLSLGTIYDAGAGRVVLGNMFTTDSIGLDLPAGGRAISVDAVLGMFVGGDVLGEILVTDGALDQAIVQGSVRRNITISNGALASLTVTGDIAPVPPVTNIKINVNGHIQSLIANSISADISNAANGPTDVTWVTSFVQTIDGGFSGSLKTGDISRPGFGDYGAYGLRINGKLDADVTVSRWVLSPIYAIAFGSGRTIWVGTELWGPPNTIYGAEVVVDAGGFGGQVIVGGHNSFGGQPGYDWNARVRADGVELTPRPYYTTLSASVGGGAAGEVPFGLHGSECQPPNFSELGAGFHSILMDSYGPVGSDGDRPLLVQFRPNGGSIGDITTELIFVMHPNGKRRQIMLVSGTFNLATARGDFFISPVRQGTQRLKCLDVDGEPNVADTWSYQIHTY